MNFIYLTTNLENGKQYVGSHSGSENDSYLGSGKIILSSIKKYGREKFKRKILEECDPSVNLFLETKYIKEYNTLVPNGYNILENGGHINYTYEIKEKLRKKKLGRKLSEETKQKMSLSRKGKKKGPMSEETKRKISKAKKGIKTWNAGKALSKTHKENISKSHTGKILSEETKNKMSKFQKGRIKSISERMNISKSKMGVNNPMYGKEVWNSGIKGAQCWISNDSSKETKFILRENLEKYLICGWTQGRKKYIT